MADYVRFPGTTDHVATDDVNILQGDTAHLANGSLGRWDAGVCTLDAADGFWNPEAGCKSIRIEAGINGTPSIGDYLPVEADQQYTFSGYLRSATPGAPAAGLKLKIWWYLDSAGGVLGSANGVAADSTDDWVQYTATGTCPSGANTCRFQIDNGPGANPVLGSAFIVRKGTSPEFVPSLRVANAVETIDPTDMPIVFAADGTPLTVGEGWAGSGYRYIRRDGAAGPIVADFNPSNIPVV